jgi:enoyl-CoA hydratase
MFQNLLTSLDNKILTITINRERKLNALNIQTLEELHLAITNAFKDAEVGGIILTGAGNKAFVAGADISELTNLDEAGGYNLAETGHSKVFNLIENGSKPVIAAINGYALGGGLELALACHIRIASENAQLGFPEVSLGLIPGYGGTQRLPRLIGAGRAFEIILFGDSVDAAFAFEIGLVNRVVPIEFLLSSATVLLEKILSRSPMAVASAIRAINSSINNKGFQTEIQEFSKCFGTTDFKEGTSAFLEKRLPNFNKAKE